MSEVICYFIGVFAGVVWAFSTVTSEELTEVQNVCSNNGGASKVVFYSLGNPKVTCVDGAVFTIK